MSVKGGVGKIIEYGGPGIRTLTVPERATITNMGTELGRDDLHLPLRQHHARIPQGTGPRSGLAGARLR